MLTADRDAGADPGWRARLASLLPPRRDAALLIGAFVASRVLLLIAAVVAESLIPRNAALTGGDSAPILRSLTSWDGWYYVGIARDGYHAAAVTGVYHDYAFLPLYPLIVGVLSLPWPGLAGLLSIVVSNVAFAVAMVLLYQLGVPIVGRRTAALAAALMALFPFGAAYAMAYAESLFLALSVGAFLAAERGRRALAGVLLGLAALTRLQGVILVLPLWLLMLARDGWRPRRSQLWLLLGVAGAVAFFVYVALLTGQPRAYLDAQIAWGRTGIGSVAPGENLGSGLSPVLATLLVVLCASVFLLVYARPDGIPLHYALIPVLYLAALLTSGLLESVGRYAMLAFPYVWLLAGRRSPAFRAGWPALSAGLLGILALLEFGGYFVP